MIPKILKNNSHDNYLFVLKSFQEQEKEETKSNQVSKDITGFVIIFLAH